MEVKIRISGNTEIIVCTTLSGKTTPYEDILRLGSPQQTGSPSIRGSIEDRKYTSIR